MDRVKVTSLSRFGVSAEDAGVLLAGEGSSVVILKSTADASPLLQEHKRRGWVRLDPVPSVGIWPFSSPSAPARAPTQAVVPAPPVHPTSEIQALRDELAGVTSLLKDLLSRPQTVVAGSSVPSQVRSGDHPIFIPSKVVPDAEATIKVAEAAVQERDVEAGREALKKLRRSK